MSTQTHTVNGIEMTDEEYARFMEMLTATIAGEQAEAEAYEAQLELVRPLTPTEVLSAILATTNTLISNLSDETIGRMQPYFSAWSDENVNYLEGDLVRYGDGDGDVYRCLQPHTSQTAWNPTDAVSLWAKVLTSTTDILPWVQPSSTNPYMKGDKVLWEGSVWVCTIDNNVWMPGVYGWEQQI